MSASIHRRTCTQLGVCQARAECRECRDMTGDGTYRTNLHRVHIVDPENPVERRGQPSLASWLWLFLTPTLVLCAVLVIVHFVAQITR